MSTLPAYAQTNLQTADWRLDYAPQAFTTWNPLTDMRVLDCGGEWPWRAMLFGRAIAYCTTEYDARQVLSEYVQDVLGNR
jgi:hypothetical protein